MQRCIVAPVMCASVRRTFTPNNDVVWHRYYMCQCGYKHARRGKSLTRTPLRIGVDIVKNIVEKHGCFVLVTTDHKTVVVFKLPLIITTSKKSVYVLKKTCKRCALGEAVLKAHRHYPQRAPGAQWTIQC